MAAPTTYEGVAEDADIHGQLFAGKKFFVAQRVVSRPHYVDLIKRNGGEVVALEKRADYLIANHVRKDCPPGSVSYTFIDKSIQAGELQDPDDHLAGPRVGTVRESGSSSRPIKTTRAAYTTAEDNILYQWVRDHTGKDGLSNGNTMYKALEREHPRHTWQSWRDRYVKKLQFMPPSAFNIPANAPPSPPSDAPAPAPTRPKKPTASKSGADAAKASAPKHVNSVEYTVDELTTEGLFTKDDWESLYACAEDIIAVSGDDYRTAWRGFAAGKSQTAGQWRQYFEKVVLPQWRKDPATKHAMIRKRFEERQAEQNANSEQDDEDDEHEVEQDDEQDAEPEAEQEAEEEIDEEPVAPVSKAASKRKRDASEDDRFESFLSDRHKGKTSSAYVLYARENKWHVWNEEQPGLDYTELHKLLMSRWNALSAEEKAPYLAQVDAQPKSAENTVTLSSQVFLSSSTVVNETPGYITEAYQKALNQLRGVVEADRDESPRPAKRQRSASPELGSHYHPLEISSAASESSESVEEELPKNPTAEQLVEADDVNAEEGTAVSQRDASDYGSASPTPRASRHKAAFDTQAILSSPSQGASLAPLAIPAGLNLLTDKPRAHENSDKLDSDLSQHTTESLEEFSQFVNENPRSSSLAPLMRPQESSPAPSESSTGSGDPDPPLGPHEVDEYFEEQRSLGFSNEYIAEALKHTRWRPELAAEVLEAWGREEPLPEKRGIWSAENDEDVEGGDGMALARLERLHTMDGWGGITERLNFLAKYRDAKGS